MINNCLNQQGSDYYKSQANVTLAVREGAMQTDFWGTGKVPFLDLDGGYKGVHFVIINQAVHLCFVYFSESGSYFTT